MSDEARDSVQETSLPTDEIPPEASWYEPTESKTIEWTDDLTVGNSLLDSQHKTLISMINTLGRGSLTVDELGEVIFGLLEYAAVHFRDEEAFFAEVAPEIVPAHFESHTVFIAGAYRFVQRFQRGEALALRKTVYDFLCDWLINHIRNEDRLYYRQSHPPKREGFFSRLFTRRSHPRI